MKLSVITVVYNDVNGLGKTINSVISQGINNYEYIIIDGGSSDGTVEIIKKYESYLSFWCSEKDDGIYDAMNKGIEKASGELISFINSGDWYEKDVLADVLNYGSDKDYDVLYGYVNKICDGKKAGYIGIGPGVEVTLDDLHLKNLFCHQGLFIKKQCFNKIGNYNLKYKVLADYDWILRAYNTNLKIKVMPWIVANFQLGGCSNVNNNGKEFTEIALNNLNGKQEYLEEINKKSRTYEQMELYQHALMNNKDIFFDILPKEKKYVIWGIGKDGQEVTKLLRNLNLNLCYYIDRSSNNKIMNGVQVISAEEFENKDMDEKIIIVSSIDYELEIEKILLNKGIDQGNYILFSQILKNVSESYKLI